MSVSWSRFRRNDLTRPSFYIRKKVQSFTGYKYSYFNWIGDSLCKFICHWLHSAEINRNIMASSDSWPKLFTWVDYFLFALTLLVSSLVGIYHAWHGASGSTSDYLMGGRKMPIFPVAMSLAARYVFEAFLLLSIVFCHGFSIFHFFKISRRDSIFHSVF